MTILRGGRRLLILSGVLSVVACAGGAGRDTVPSSTDVVADAGAPSRSAEGYEYVARRPLAVVALAEARGMEPAIARAAIDHLAEAVDACAADEEKKGSPAQGAARVVAQIDGDGRVTGTTVRIDRGAGVAESAVLCLVAPTRLMTFPPTDAGLRGMAIEALWGRGVPRVR
jgi:hypothetical protein